MIKVRWPHIQWAAVLAGVLVISLFAVRIHSFIGMDKSRFDLNLFAGTHLALERDNNRYFTTFAHAGVLDLAQKNIGLSKNKNYRSFGSDRRATVPLEKLYFNRYALKTGGELQEFSVRPISDRQFLYGIQNSTRLKVVDVQPVRDAWMIGAEASFSGITRRIISIDADELVVEGLLGELQTPNSIQISLQTKETQAGSMDGITLAAYSDTVFWQNGVWVYDDRAFLFAVNIGGSQPGDSLVFQDGAERIVKFVRSNGVIELEGGQLDPNLHGLGTRIFARHIARKKQDIKQFVSFSSSSNAEFYKGINQYQRVLIPFDAVSSISVNDYVMFADGILRRIGMVGKGYVDVDLYSYFPNSINESRWKLILEAHKLHFDNFEVTRLPGIQPLNSRTFISGNRFLHVRADFAEVDKPNIGVVNSSKKTEATEVNLTVSPKIWATYTGIVNLLYDSIHPINRDYLIHVLGSSERKKYVQDFRSAQPDYVQTSVDNFDNSNFHAWSLNTSWNFYEQVLLNYSPAYSYDYMAIWRRNRNSWVLNNPVVPKLIGAEFPVRLPSSTIKTTCEVELYTVTVNYDVTNPWKWIPVFGRTDRYLINKKGAENPLPVSLPPEEQSWSFPLVRRVDKPLELSLDEIHPIGNFSRISIKQISVAKMLLPQETIKNMFFPIYFPMEVICGKS